MKKDGKLFLSNFLSRPFVLVDILVSVSQLSSDEAVKRVLAGEKVDVKTKASTSKSQDKENREGRERPQEKDVRISFPICGFWPHKRFDFYKFKKPLK